jgi:hypothetical protein
MDTGWTLDDQRMSSRCPVLPHGLPPPPPHAMLAVQAERAQLQLAQLAAVPATHGNRDQGPASAARVT